MVLRAAKRLQVSAFVENIDVWSRYYEKFPNDVIFPVMWIEETASIDDALGDLVRARVTNNLFIMSAAENGLIAFGAGLIVLVISVGVFRRLTKRREDECLINENEANEANEAHVALKD